MERKGMGEGAPGSTSRAGTRRRGRSDERSESPKCKGRGNGDARRSRIGALPCGPSWGNGAPGWDGACHGRRTSLRTPLRLWERNQYRNTFLRSFPRGEGDLRVAPWKHSRKGPSDLSRPDSAREAERSREFCRKRGRLVRFRSGGSYCAFKQLSSWGARRIGPGWKRIRSPRPSLGENRCGTRPGRSPCTC